MVCCSLMVKTLSRCPLLCFRGSSCERGSWELNVMMVQLLQVLERNWLSPRSGEECSAELCVPSHISRVSAAGPGTGSSLLLVWKLLGKLGLVWVSQENKSRCFLVLSDLLVVSVVAFSHMCLCGLLKEASFYSHRRKLSLKKTGSPRNFA